MKYIELSNGMKARVSNADYERLAQHSWTAQKRATGDFHAARYVNNKYVYMHQAIKKAKVGFQIDHKDGNGLNNVRSNLRYANKQQNQWNRGRTWGSSSYKGVSWHIQTYKWRAYIQTPAKKMKHLGLFHDEWEAAKAYNRAAAEMFGRFARFNKAA